MFDEKKNDAIAKRAKAIFSAGGLDRAIEQGSIDASLEVTLSEALVLGLRALDHAIHTILCQKPGGSRNSPDRFKERH